MVHFYDVWFEYMERIRRNSKNFQVSKYDESLYTEVGTLVTTTDAYSK